MKTNSVISIPWLMTACAVLLLCGSTSLAQTIVVRYVDASAATSGDGTSWSTAYDNLQTALANANPGEDEIYQLWVKAGTYKPTSGTDRSISFGMKTDVEIYGGFDGTEETLEERDWQAVENATILSGDLNVDDEPNFINRTDNSYHVVRAEGVDSTARLDGFTITGGYADTSASGRRGAGLYIVEKDNPHPVPDDPSSPRIINCTFIDNAARSATGAIGVGGAVYSSPSSTTNTLDFTNCAFLDNQTALSGGAVYLANMNAASFSSCEFIGNSTTRLPTSGAGTHGGGGLYVSGNSSQVVTLIDSVFRHNSTSAGEECGRESFTDAGGGV